MAKELTTRENTDVALSKSKSFMGIIKNIFNNKIVQDDDSWIQRLWDWADENDITDLEWVDNDALDEDGYWIGLARDKELLLNSKTLNIEYNELSDIPKEIGKIINLSELYLSSNRLEYIPKEILNLTNLTTLMISSNQLVDLPKEIGNLNKLSGLALPDNQLLNLPKEIGNLSDLTALRLDKNKLYELPKEVENLKSLKMLELSDNNFTKLPEAIFQLTNLKNLYFYGNNICKIPEEIGNLLNLTALGLGENQITILPKQIGHLTNLTILGIAENKLEVLPSEICNLVDLKDLNIGKNQLKQLPDGIDNLKSLELLVLTNNPLTLTDKQKDWINQLIDDGCDVQLDDDVRERDIHTKEDTKNKKSSLSSYFNHSVSGNTVDSEIVEDDDSWMQRLWDWADENDISEDKLPRNKSDLTNHTELYLDDNNITELPKEIGRLTNLTGLYLYENDMAKLPKEIVQLENLTDLNIALNNFTEVQEEIIQLKNLEVLNLYENRLVELPKAIGELSKLNMLILGDNDLTKLPKEIGQLQDLTRLILVYNYLTELPKEIGQLNNLIELNLRGNDLTGLPDEIINLTNLSILHIDGNPDLAFTQDQIKWIEELKKSGCDIHLDDDALEESKNLENLEKVEEKNTFTFDNGQLVVGIPGRKSIIIESLHAIIHNFSDKKLCIQKQFNKIKNEETDIYYSIIGQKHLDYSGSKFNVQDAKNIYEKAGSIGVCDSGIKVKISSYIEWRFDFYQNDIYLEAVLVKNKTKTKLYNRTLKNGPSELLSVYEMYIENGYKEGLKIFEGTESYDNNQNSNNNLQSKLSQDNEPMSIEDIISQKGLAYAVEGAALLVNNKIDSDKIALQFILEELDAAKNGNKDATDFVKNSGFEPSEYIGAMSNSFSQVDGPDGPQMTLHSIAMHISDINLKVKFITQVVDKIMQRYSLGKYSMHKGNQFYKDRN